MGYGDSDAENMFRMVLEELISAREKCGSLEKDVHSRDLRIRELAHEGSLKLSDADDHIAREKEKIISLGSKLYMAAYAVKDTADTEEFTKLRDVLHESANTFDEIPF